MLKENNMEPGSMNKKIPLTQGKFATVDEEDYDFLMQWKWLAHKSGDNWYAVRHENGREVQMHRIVNNTSDEMQTDHVDRDGLNNCRHNLRDCTHQQNCFNRGPLKNSSSRFKGVGWCARARFWMARIKIDGKLKNLGYFKSEIDAARVYDKNAKEKFGDFAYLNFP